MSSVDEIPAAPAKAINLPSLAFWTAFVFIFLLSGLITMTDLVPYRMGLVSLIAIPLMLWRGLRFDRISTTFIVLGGIVLLSAWWNDVSWLDGVFFCRIPVFAYCTYYLASEYIDQRRAPIVMRACIAVVVIQLPLMILQQLTYDHLPRAWTARSSLIDFDFGSFNYKGDAPLVYFVILAIVFLLFDLRSRRLLRHPFLFLSWCVMTVAVNHAQIGKVIFGAVWGIYIFVRGRLTALVYTLLLFVVLLVGLASTGLLEPAWENFLKRMDRVELVADPVRLENYLQGGYDRGAALYYYLSSDPLILGQGPSAFTDPLTREKQRGNYGHILTFYSEVGLLGLSVSLLIMFLVATWGGPGYLKLRLAPLLSFGCLVILAFTTEVMNDVSVFFAYSIFTRIALLPWHPVSDSKSGQEATTPASGDGVPEVPLADPT